MTAEVIRHVMLLSHWKATDLFLSDIGVLFSELSISECTPAVRDLCVDPQAAGPNREVMKQLRHQLNSTQAYPACILKDEHPALPNDLIVSDDQL